MPAFFAKKDHAAPILPPKKGPSYMAVAQRHTGWIPCRGQTHTVSLRTPNTNGAFGQHTALHSGCVVIFLPKKERIKAGMGNHCSGRAARPSQTSSVKLPPDSPIRIFATRYCVFRQPPSVRQVAGPCLFRVAYCSQYRVLGVDTASMPGLRAVLPQAPWRAHSAGARTRLGVMAAKKGKAGPTE